MFKGEVETWKTETRANQLSSNEKNIYMYIISNTHTHTLDGINGRLANKEGKISKL